MKFSTFLNEGLIKLPDRLLSDLTTYFVYWYLAYARAIANDMIDIDDEEMESIIDGVSILAKKNGTKNPSTSDINKTLTVRSVSKRFNVDDFPEPYINRVLKTNGEKVVKDVLSEPVKFVIAFKLHPKIDIDDHPQGIYYPDDNSIMISIANIITPIESFIEALIKLNIRNAQAIMNHTIGVIEHELTHSIQAMILYKLHHKQYSFDGISASNLSDEDKKQDEYFTSQVEFYPSIKGAIREIESEFLKLGLKTQQEKREFFDKYTYVDSKIDAGSIGRSNFFKSLRRSDYQNWKKAVKLLADKVLK